MQRAFHYDSSKQRLNYYNFRARRTFILKKWLWSNGLPWELISFLFIKNNEDRSLGGTTRRKTIKIKGTLDFYCLLESQHRRVALDPVRPLRHCIEKDISEFRRKISIHCAHDICSVNDFWSVNEPARFAYNWTNGEYNVTFPLGQRKCREFGPIEQTKDQNKHINISSVCAATSLHAPNTVIQIQVVRRIFHQNQSCRDLSRILGHSL